MVAEDTGQLSSPVHELVSAFELRLILSTSGWLRSRDSDHGLTLQLLPAELLTHLQPRGSTHILGALKALRSRQRLVVKSSVLGPSARPVICLQYLLSTSMVLSRIVPSVIDNDDAGRRVALLRLLPPGSVAEYACRPLRRQLVLDEAELLVLLELVLKFLKLEVLVGELLGGADRRHVGVRLPRLRLPRVVEVQRELLGSAHLGTECLAALATWLPVARAREVSRLIRVRHRRVVARVHIILILFYL